MSKLEKIGVHDKETGEILSTDIYDSIKTEQKRKRKKELEYKLNNTPDELTSLEIEELVKIQNKRLSVIKEYDFFEEYYTGNKKRLIEAIDTLSDQAYKCFSVLVLKYTSCENTLQYKNNINIVMDKDIAKVLNISMSKWYNIKKELVEFNAIRRISFENKKLYKINPTLIGHSMKITKCTYYAFRDKLKEEFSIMKRLYWDKRLIEEFGYDVFEVKIKVKK